MGAILSLAVGCLDKPAPWAPDGAVDGTDANSGREVITDGLTEWDGLAEDFGPQDDGVDLCALVDCGLHGHCVLSAQGQPDCDCEEGYEAFGLGCVVDPCYGETCTGHGKCVKANGVAACKCDDGHKALGLACVRKLDPELIRCLPHDVGHGRSVCLSPVALYSAEGAVGCDPELSEANALEPKVSHREEYLDDESCAETSDQGNCGWSAAFGVGLAVEALACEMGQPADVSEPHLRWAGNSLGLESGKTWQIAHALAAAKSTSLVSGEIWSFEAQSESCAAKAPEEVKSPLVSEGSHRIRDFKGVEALDVDALRSAVAAGHNIVYSVPVFLYAGWAPYYPFSWSGGDIDLAAPPPALPVCSKGTDASQLINCRCEWDGQCPDTPFGHPRTCVQGRCADGYHAVLVTGYDDEGKGKFEFRNSWGVTWGDKGYGSLSYDYIRSFGLGGAYPTELVEPCDSGGGKKCFNGDIYLFDVCGNPLELKEDCGSGCALGSEDSSW